MVLLWRPYHGAKHNTSPLEKNSILKCILFLFFSPDMKFHRSFFMILEIRLISIIKKYNGIV